MASLINQSLSQFKEPRSVHLSLSRFLERLELEPLTVLGAALVN